eukprot:m.30368 g.30368  ORF g.30368 m.30368 type:complete len:158 (-) comp16272_c0_seq1:410-883(-)
MPWTAPAVTKCHRSGGTAYAAESIKIRINGSECLYLKSNFTCCECGLKLTLNTYKVSDFGDDEIFCAKCVPKQAPSQSAESMETDRTRKAAALAKDVGMINEQMRGADETLGKGAQGGTTKELERATQASSLFRDVGMVNQQVRGAADTVGKDSIDK